MEDLISIVVPVYNVEKYLEICVSSILNQTYQNIEIILVDDGSTDACPQMCDRYAEKDERVSVIHQTNGGLSDARNTGLKIAKGKYITFIDSDDYVGKNFILNLYQAISDTGADVGFCDYEEVAEDCNQMYSEKTAKYEILSGYDCLKETFVPSRHGMEFVAWGKLYDIALFRENTIQYPKGKLHEDTYTTYKLYYFSDSIVFVPHKDYYYRKRKGSIMTDSFSLKRLDSLQATRSMCLFFYEKKENELFSLAVNMHLKTCLTMYYELNKSYNGEDKKIQKEKVIGQYKNDYRSWRKKADLGIIKQFCYDLIYVFPSVQLIRLRYRLK